MTVVAIAIAALLLIAAFVGMKRNSGWSSWSMAVGVIALLVALWPQNRAATERPQTSTLGEGSSLQGPIEPLPEAIEDEVDTVEHNSDVHVPQMDQYDGFVSSSACRECHRREYHTWHDSYHRRMTQQASVEGIIGNFDGQVLTNHIAGDSIQLRKENDRHYFRMLFERGKPKHGPWREVVLTTGSHHTQVYWYPTRLGNTLGMMPFEYLKETEQWIPRDAAFLRPPGVRTESEIGRWNDGCINCHTTGPHAGGLKDTSVYKSKVGEFGIACEACHGTGEKHVDLQRKAKADGVELPRNEDPIVNPVDLIHQRSSEVCGRCHSIPYDKRTDPAEPDYRPGEILSDKRFVVRHGEPEKLQEFFRLAPDNLLLKEDIDLDLKFSFWGDGMIRLAGREFAGLINSPCHTKGTMSCFSCHKLHQSSKDPRPAQEWADDQLDVDMRGNKACVQCHAAEDYDSRKHTHHTASSVGSNCYNCHMPHTSYGLLKAVRSHTVTSPTVQETIEFKRQNACNICHVDKSLDWTAGHLREWYGVESPALTGEQKELSAILLASLKGDAIDRAFAAWYLGWAPAQKASGTDWMPPVLTTLMEDDYHVVRLMAYRALKQIPGYEETKFDYVSSPSNRAAAVAKIREQWNGEQRSASRQAVLLRADGSFDQARADRLLDLRDHRPVILTE